MQDNENRIAQFQKVSVEQFDFDWINTLESFDSPYERIKLPERATKGSAGYDFFSPLTFDLKPGQVITVPTGVRVKIAEGWMLMLFPRSSLGFKYRMRLGNTVGIVDSDYYDAKNEGHIYIRVTNEGNHTIHIDEGQKFAQGIFVPYGLTEDDDTSAERTGGVGSTGK